VSVSLVERARGNLAGLFLTTIDILFSLTGNQDRHFVRRNFQQYKHTEISTSAY